MPCEVCFNKGPLGAGVSWVQTGYNATTPLGVFGAGGTDFTEFLTGDEPCIEITGALTGFYRFTGTQGGDTRAITVAVTEPSDPGSPVDQTFCISETGIVNLLQFFIGADTGGTFSANINSPTFPPLSLFASGNLDLSKFTTAGTWLVDYNVPTQQPAGFPSNTCVNCVSKATIAITFQAACNPGTDNFIQISPTQGSFNLRNFLGGSPDLDLTWTQTAGTSVTITGGNLGTVNLDAAAGCNFVFRAACTSECGTAFAFITVEKLVDLGVSVDYTDANEDELTVSFDACPGATFEWLLDTGSGFNPTGSTAVTQGSLVVGTYRSCVTCNECTQCADFVVTAADCSENEPAVSFNYSEAGNCLTITPIGSVTGVLSDVIQFQRNGGAWNTYSAPICGCDLRRYLSVTPSCVVSGAGIRAGFINAMRCAGDSIDRVFEIDGFGNVVTNIHANGNSFVTSAYTPTQWVNDKNRVITFHIRVSTPIGYIFQRITFTYTGGIGDAPSCSNISTTVQNLPEIFYNINARRTVTFNNGCPPITITQPWTNPIPCQVYVIANLCNLGSTPAVCATVYNAEGCANNPSYQWYLNGSLLPGETTFAVEQSYGTGNYTVVVTCGACSATASANVPGACAVTVQITGTTTRTATVTGCSGTIFYQWQFFAGGVWTNVGTNSNTYTPTQQGEYRVLVSCPPCDGIATFTHTVPCLIDVTVSGTAPNWTAASSGCSGATTWQWYVLVSGVWNAIGGATSASYTATTAGTYKVRGTCLAVGANCFDELVVTYSIPCTIQVQINLVGSTLSYSIISGCPGGATAQIWYLNGVQIGTAPTQAVIGNGTYTVQVWCGPTCQTSATYTINNACSVNITGWTYNSGANLITGTYTSSCPGGTVQRLIQYSPTGTGWTTLATNQNTWTPTSTGYYRYIVRCDLGNNGSWDCVDEETIFVNVATLCDWCVIMPFSFFAFISGIYVGGTNIIAGSTFDACIPASMVAMRTAIQNWLTANSYVYTLIDIADTCERDFRLCINGTNANFDKITGTTDNVTLDAIQGFFCGCGRICNYTTAESVNLVRVIRADFGQLNNVPAWDLTIAGDRTNLQTAIQNALTAAGKVYSSVSVTSTGVTINGTDACFHYLQRTVDDTNASISFFNRSSCNK